MAQDPTSWDALIEKARPRLLFLVQRAGVPLQDCEDVVHEAILSSLDQIARGKFRRESSLGTWLQVILGGKVTDYWRTHTRRAHVITSDFADESSEPSPQIIHPRLDHEQETRLDMIALEQAVNRLTPRHRIAIILFEIGGVSTREISRQLGWPEGTVSRIIAEARRDLAGFLRGNEEIRPVRRQK